MSQPFDYAAFRAEFVRLKAMTSYERAIEKAETAKRTHYRRMAGLVRQHAATHTPEHTYEELTYSGILKRNVWKKMRYFNWGNSQGEMDTAFIHKRAQWNWWVDNFLWVQGQPRVFYIRDDQSTPNMVELATSPNTERDAIANVRSLCFRLELEAHEQLKKAA